MNKTGKFSILNQIKSTGESSGNIYFLKIHVYHKSRCNESPTSTNIPNIPLIAIDDVEKIIIKVYHRAEAVMDSFKLTEILKKNKLNDLDKISSFVFRQFNTKSTVVYSIINIYDSLDSYDNRI
jgi:hypothetical protein